MDELCSEAAGDDIAAKLLLLLTEEALMEAADAGGVGRKLLEVFTFSSLGVDIVDFNNSEVGVVERPRLDRRGWDADIS